MDIIKKTTLLIALAISMTYQCLAQIDVDFTVPTSEACNSLQVTFTDLSSSTDGQIINWQWDLGGTIANKQNPSIIFNEVGLYDICLTVTDDEGATETLCKEEFIKIFANPIADFTVDPASGCSPLVTYFTNTSISPNGDIAELVWDIGGSTNLAILSNQDSILSSTYTSPGTYNSSLFITDEKGCTDIKIVAEAVTVNPLPIADISYEVISGCDLPWEVSFYNNTEDNTSYIWDFGNGETFEGPNPPNVIYTEEGNYNISVALNRLGCVDTFKIENFINPGQEPDFVVTPEGACVNTPLTFSASNQIQADSIFWDFGDGSTANTDNPIHAFTTADCYEVTMIRYVGECVDTVINPCVQINPLPSITTNISNQNVCELPANIGLQATADEPGSFQWTYSDGSTENNFFTDTVDVLINDYGSYNIDLTFTSTEGCTVVAPTEEVLVKEFKALLPVSNHRGCAPLTGILSDSITTQNPIVDYQWSIGNPEILQLSGPSPTFEISDTGRYDLQLIVTNDIGCIDTVYAVDYIHVGMPPEVDFIATPLEECIQAPKDFTALTSDYADAWVWGTGNDDTLSIDQNPTLYLGAAMEWTISLTTYHNGCTNTIVKPNYINILEPAANYSIQYNCDDPYTINFIDRITGADSSYYAIKLSNTETDTFFNQSIESFTFPERGKYIVERYAINYNTGCEHERLDTVYITDPKASFTLDTLQGCSPLTIEINGSSIDAINHDYIISGATIDSALTVSNPTLTFTESGVFMGPSLVVSDLHGCTDTLSVIDSIQVNAATALPDYINYACIPDSILLTDESFDRLGSIIERRWYFDDASIYSEEDSFYVQINENKFYSLALAVTDTWGCTDSVFYTNAVFGFNIDSNIIVSDSLTCIGQEVQFELENTEQDIVFYEWDFGDGSPNSNISHPIHSYTEEGFYTVCLTVENNRGCIDSICKDQFIKVTNPKALFTGSPLYESCPPLLTTFQNESENATSYTWDFGDSSGLSDTENPSHLYNDPGTYAVTLIASNSPFCADTLVRSGYVLVDGPSGGFEIETDSSCLPLTLSITAYADDLYTFAYDYGNGVTSISEGDRMNDTTTYIFDEVGTFTPKLILSDGNGCTRSFTSTPIEVNDLTLSLDSDTDITCLTPANVNITNLSESTASDIVYEWSVTGTEAINENTDNLILELFEPGNYNVDLIGIAANCVDTLSFDSLIIIGTEPTVNFALDLNQACELTDINFDNNTINDYGEIVSYYWDFGDGNSSTDIDPSHTYNNADNYIINLTAVTEYGCEATGSAEVNILENVVPILPPDYTMCIGDSVQLLVEIIGSGVNDIIYNWSNPGALSCSDCTFPFASPTDTSEFILYTEHANGCLSSDTIIINVVPIAGPQLSLSMDTIICHQDTARIAISNYNPDLDYTWDPHPTLDCLDCESVSAFPDVNTYYAVTVRNEFGCFKKDSLFVEVERNIDDFLINSKGVCEGEQTILSSDMAVLNPTWFVDDNIFCTDCYEVEVVADENKYFYLNATSNAGCEYLDSIFIIAVPDNSIVISDDDLICLGEEVTLASQGYGDASWQPTISLSNANEMNVVATPMQTTSYIVTYILDECELQDSVLIEVIEKVDIEATGDTICLDDEALLTVDGIVDTYQWYDEGNLISTMDTILYPTTIDKELIVIGKLGLCEDDTAYAQVFVQPDIDYEILTDEYELFINSADKVDAIYDEQAEYTYTWSPEAGLSCIDCPEPKISDIGMAMNYTVTVTDNLTGCSIEDFIQVRFINKCSQKAFYIPNIFSPNGDGVNDLFYVSAEDPNEFDAIHIFDRWGNKIYASEDINASWDGLYFGKPLTSGVYPYRIDYTCIDTGESYVFYGDVTIIR